MPEIRKPSLAEALAMPAEELASGIRLGLLSIDSFDRKELESA